MTYLRGNIIGLAMLIAICLAGCDKRQAPPTEAKSGDVRENVIHENAPVATPAASNTGSAPAATSGVNLTPTARGS